MNIRFQCPECAGEIVAPGAYSGRQGKCPHCAKAVTIPAPQSSETSSPQIIHDPLPLGANQAHTQKPEPAGPYTGEEHRNFIRFAVTDAKVICAVAGGLGTCNEYELLDLSRGGLQFRTSAAKSKFGGNPTCPYTRDDRLLLTLHVPAFLKPMKIKGKVTRIVTALSGNGYDISVCITSYSPEDMLQLEKLEKSESLRKMLRDKNSLI